MSYKAYVVFLTYHLLLITYYYLVGSCKMSIKSALADSILFTVLSICVFK